MGFVVRADKQHTQASQDRMDVLKGRTILPRAGATGLEVSSSQSTTSSMMPGAAHCETVGHADAGSRRVEPLGDNQELRVLRAS